MSFRSFVSTGWLIASLLLTTNAFAVSPVQIGPDGVILPAHSSAIGYLKATTNKISIIVPDLEKWFEVGEVAPLLQKNQRFYIGLHESENGYTRIYAIPRVNQRGEGTAWITQENEVVIASQIASQTGRFFLRASELLPIVGETDGYYVATCERYGRLFQLSLPVDQPGLLRLDKLPENIRYLVSLKLQHFQVSTKSDSEDDALHFPIDNAQDNLSTPVGLHEKTVIKTPDFINPYPEPVLKRSNPQPAPNRVVPKTARPLQPSTPASDLDELTMAPLPPKKKRIRRHVIDASNLESLAVDFSETNDNKGDHKVAQTDEAKVSSAEHDTATRKPEASGAPASTSPAPTTPAIEPAQAVAASQPAAPPPSTIAATSPAPTTPAIEPAQVVAASQPAAPPPSAIAAPSTPTTADVSAATEAPADPKVPLTAESTVAAGTSPAEAIPTLDVAAAEPSTTAVTVDDGTHVLAKSVRASHVSGSGEEEGSSKVANFAMTLLILIALLTAGFVIVVFVLALILNRGRKKDTPSDLHQKAPKWNTSLRFGRRKSVPPAVPTPPAILRKDPDSAPDTPTLNEGDETSPDEESEDDDVTNEDSGTFTGSLESFSVAELIQFLNSSKETGVLVIATSLDHMTSKLYFERGEIVDAISDKSTGEAAASDILSLSDGLFSFNRQNEVATRRTIKKSTMSLLIETSPKVTAPNVTAPVSG